MLRGLRNTFVTRRPSLNRQRKDDATDRIAESLDVFGQVCAEPMLANAAVILFLNKCGQSGLLCLGDKAE